MKRILLLTILAAISLPSRAQTPSIRPDHPRIFFNAESWKTIKERAEGENARYVKQLLKEVDGYTDNPVCTNTGPIPPQNRSLPIPQVREYGREAAMCALAWRFTGEERYLEKAKKMLTVSVDAYTEATRNIRPVSWYTHSRVNALCAYDWIYEALTREERERIIVPLVRHVEMIQPSYGLNIPRNSEGSRSTGFYGTANLLWYSGLAAAGDGFCDELAAKHLKTGYEKLCDVLAYRDSTAGDDGALCSCAPVYAIGHYPYAHFNFFYTYLSATGENIAPRYPNMALLPNWIWWLWIRDTDKPVSIRYAGQGDAYHNNNVTTSTRLWEQLSEYLYFYKDCDPDCYGMTAALRDFGRVRDIKMNVYPILPFIIETQFPYEDYYRDNLVNSPLKARHFETLGQIHMRSSWMPDATYCTFTAGATLLGHKHYDENNFTIFKYDHLALDTGDRCKETDFNLVYYYSQSVAHNVVLIHKPDEPLPYHWGIKSDNPEDNRNYGGMTEISGAEIKAFETNGKFTYVASDATSCYGAKCTEAVRQFVFVYPDYFIVYDRVGAADRNYGKEWLLHTKDKPSVKGNLMRADSGNGRLFCQTLLPADARLELVGGPGREYWAGRNYPLDPATDEEYRKDALRRGRGPYMGAWRLEVKPAAANEDDRFLNVLTAAYVDRARPVPAKLEKDASRDGVTLTVDGQKMTFWFNRDGEIGGEVVIGGSRRPLTDKVQEQKGVIFE